jgi:dephospho-CoA kinase
MERGRLLVVQVPLLAVAPDFLDLAVVVIAITADENTRLERAIERGMDPQDAKNRLALQATDEARIAISDTIFTNNGSPQELRAQIKAWFEDRIESRLF